MLLNYINRSYNQAINTLIGYISEKLPEMTDHTLANPFIRMAHVWAAIQEQLQYYIDDTANETFFPLARRYKSLVAHAYSRGYRIKNNIPASCDLTFYLDAPATTAITIPAYTQVTDENENVVYYTTQQVTIAVGETAINAWAKQETSSYITVSIIGNGEPNQKYAVDFDVSDSTIEAVSIGGVVGSNIWNAVESLKYSTDTDRHFVLTVNYDGTPCIIFGDGVTGTIPLSDEEIEIRYKTTSGRSGNVGAGVLTKIISTPNSLLKVGNNLASSGGRNTENAFDIRRGLYALTRTFGTAVTNQDLINLSILYGGVDSANAEVIGDGKIGVWVVPSGGGVASSGLLNGLKIFLDQRKAIGRELEVKSAGVVELVLSIKVVLEANYTAISRKQLVENALLDLFSSRNQKVKGYLRISDIYEAVENIEGVTNSEIKQLSLFPYATPLNTLGSLDFSVKVTDLSLSTKRWEIQFVGGGKYHLFKEGEFMGLLNLDATYNFTEIDITVNSNASYTIGEKWEFYSYKKNGSIDLSENSIINLSFGNLNIEI